MPETELAQWAEKQQQDVRERCRRRQQEAEDKHIARKGKLSRAALRYADAWHRRQAGTSQPGQLDEAWDELVFQAISYADPE